MKTKRSIDKDSEGRMLEAKETLFDVLIQPIKKILEFRFLTLFVVSFIFYNLDYSQISFINFERPPFPKWMSENMQRACGLIIPFCIALFHPSFRYVIKITETIQHAIFQNERLRKYTNSSEVIKEFVQYEKQNKALLDELNSAKAAKEVAIENQGIAEQNLQSVNELLKFAEENENTIKGELDHEIIDKGLIITEKEQLAQVIDQLKDENRKMREAEMIYCMLRYVIDGKIINVETKNIYLKRMTRNWVKDLDKLNELFEFLLTRGFVFGNLDNYTISKKGKESFDQSFIKG